jgi:hypothetical protein
MRPNTEGDSPPTAPPVPQPNEFVRWGLGCLVASAALLGVVILAFVIFVALEPPAWVQIGVGIGLAAAGAGLAWLVASALGQTMGKGEDRTSTLDRFKRVRSRR